MGIEAKIDGAIRGVPVDLPDFSDDSVAKLGWRPEAGDTGLPVLTLDRAAYLNNVDAMFTYAAAVGVDIAPHVKTPMAPALADDLAARGAWGLTVADARQAFVFLKAGFRKLVLANQIGGARSGQRLGRMLARFPDAEMILFVDGVEALAAVNAAGEAAGRPLDVLVEVGGARAGARTIDDVAGIVSAATRASFVRLSGVAAYEGASATADADGTRRAIAGLHALAGEALALVRQAEPGRRLIISSGGSSFFDLVVADLAELARADGNTRLLLRSGAIFFHDHGVYRRGLAELDRRRGFAPAGLGPASMAFRPALRIWAEVLSRPAATLAICGMGMRDVSFDQGFPEPLAAWREGRRIAPAERTVRKLNDQHAFLAIAPDDGLEVGDIVEFGISHPCTCIDRWRWIFELDEAGSVRRLVPTFFG
ncbi:alanine racemase [Aquamicrobium sp. LC103]|uniref:alanine racemase n=1 Tax=Aquamicrobium sp. LC103 TaxID=1120658 RepID=UPI00063E9ADB|nr:alanine racemase [Aquamicrobium sp. LC103]TKT69605.1 amino acid deaminase [Aquamicrobium sp. LC103]